MRYGNKSVISIIRPDEPAKEDDIHYQIIPEEQMPMLPNGRRLDIMLNGLSLFNRNIAFAFYEPYINAVFNRLLEHVKDWKTDDQFQFIMDALAVINPQFVQEELDAMKTTHTSKKEFMENAYQEGIYVKIEPFITTLTIRDSMVTLYKKFEEILKPQKLKVWYPPRQEYVDSLLPCIAGETYVMVLKQDAAKAVSARNAGGVSPEGLPIKSNAKSNYMAELSDTAVKLGEYDRLTFNIGMTNEDLIKYIMLMRTSVEGRGWLEKYIYNPDTPLPKRFENRAVRINNCYMTVLGEELDLVPRQNMLVLPSADTLRTYIFRNTVLTMSEYDMYWLHRLALRFDQIRKKEVKKNREYDTMTLWNYTFSDTDYPEGWLDDEKKKILFQFVDDILLTNK